MSDTRRFQFCLLASLLLNSLGLLLAGWLWRPAPIPIPIRRPHLKWVTLALPRVPVPHPAAPARPVRMTQAQPVTRQRRASNAVPKPRKPVPVRPKKRLRPGARVHFSQPAPLTQPTGGAEAGAPIPAAPPIMAARPPAAPAPTVITGERPTLLTAPRTDAPLSPLPAPAPKRLSAQEATASTLPAPPASPASSDHGGGEANAGQSAGSGEGAGKGAGVGSGASRDAGEPFGVGRGMAGDGGLRHVVYVLDISGSMSSRIDRAEEELRRALNGLQPGETFNIIAFSDRIQPFDTGMASATPDMARRADYFLTTLQVSGGTDLEGAMAHALSLPDVNEVVVLTDGVPTVGETDFKKLARRIRALNRTHARISTVGMVGKNPDGTDDSFEATKLLQQIARDSGGASKLVSLGVASP